MQFEVTNRLLPVGVLLLGQPASRPICRADRSIRCKVAVRSQVHRHPNGGIAGLEDFLIASDMADHPSDENSNSRDMRPVNTGSVELDHATNRLLDAVRNAIGGNEVRLAFKRPHPTIFTTARMIVWVAVCSKAGFEPTIKG